LEQPNSVTPKEILGRTRATPRRAQATVSHPLSHLPHGLRAPLLRPAPLLHALPPPPLRASAPMRAARRGLRPAAARSSPKAFPAPTQRRPGHSHRMDPAAGASPAAHGHSLNVGELETRADPPARPRRAMLARPPQPRMPARPPQPRCFACHPNYPTGERGERAAGEALGRWRGPCQTERERERDGKQRARSRAAAAASPRRPGGRVPTATTSRRGVRARPLPPRARAPPPSPRARAAWRWELAAPPSRARPHRCRACGTSREQRRAWPAGEQRRAALAPLPRRGSARELRRRRGQGRSPAGAEASRGVHKPVGTQAQARRCGGGGAAEVRPTRSERAAAKRRNGKSKPRVARPPPARVERRAFGCSQGSLPRAYMI